MPEKEVVIPDMIFESDYTVVFFVSSLDEKLGPLFTRLVNGEVIDYWFSWDVLRFGEDKYVVVLEIGWDVEESVALAIPMDAWHYLPLIRRKGMVALVTNAPVPTGELQDLIHDSAEFQPWTLVIRNAERGMDELADEVSSLEEPDETSVYLVRLLRGQISSDGSVYIH
ncbi:hypothetical protein ACP3TJ_02325 [Desulforudis sp. 1088]|uniref:hypothetical protein n=1 Tax=unclassified Candidatus Desulforudis TaxID=2635950 RepID=UPI00348F80FB